MADYILSTFCSGIGSPEQAAAEIEAEDNITHNIGFYCEIDKYARTTYEANFEAGFLIPDMTKSEYDTPEHYSDVVVGGIPCQAFSLAGLRKGELDPRGLLIYDYIRYVKKHKPKAFIIENVKGLLSDSSGKTFQNWLHLLGQSVNGHHQMFNHEDSLPYNLHWTVLNSKDFGVPQNRERVFIVGIRNDIPNTFRFPVGFRLDKRLKDVLESSVDEKYYLSDTALQYIVKDSGKWSDRLSMMNTDTDTYAGCVTANHAKGVPYNMLTETDPILISNSDTNRKNKIEEIVPPLRSHNGCGHDNVIVLEQSDPQCVAIRGRGEKGDIRQELEPRTDGVTNTITSVQKDNLLVVREATKQGFAIAGDGDSINLSNPNSETRRGRVGNQIANTLDTACNQAVVVKEEPQIIQRGHGFNKGGVHDICPTITGNSFHDNNHVTEPTILQTNLSGQTYENDYAGTLRAGASSNYQVVKNNYRIRRLTPLECFRLQGFPDSFFYKAKYESLEKSRILFAKFPKKLKNKVTHKVTGEYVIERMSDSQLYKQAGNTITVNVIKAVLRNVLRTILNK